MYSLIIGSLMYFIALAILWGLGVYALILLIKALKIYIDKKS